MTEAMMPVTVEQWKKALELHSAAHPYPNQHDDFLAGWRAACALNTRATPPSPEPVAWIRPNWNDPTTFDGHSPVSTYYTNGWLPLYLTANGSQPDRVVDVLRGCEGIESGPNGRGGMRVVAHFPTPGDETPLFVWLSTLDAMDQSND